MSVNTPNFTWRNNHGAAANTDYLTRVESAFRRTAVRYLALATTLLALLHIYAQYPHNITFLVLGSLWKSLNWHPVIFLNSFFNTLGQAPAWNLWLLTDPLALYALLYLAGSVNSSFNDMCSNTKRRFVAWAQRRACAWLERRALKLYSGKYTAVHALRRALEDVDLPEVQKNVRASHGEAAANRLAACIVMQRVVDAVGARAYEYQMANREQARAEPSVGSRVMFWGNDWKTKVQDDIAKTNDIVLMKDVDGYLNPDELLQHGCAVMLYTYDPHFAASRVPDGRYHFDSDGCLNMFMDGGAHYRHKIYAYGSSDSVAAEKDGEYTVYGVERRLLPGQRQLVLLVPIVRWTGYFTSWIAKMFAWAPTLTHLDPIVKLYSNIDELPNGKLHVNHAKGVRFIRGDQIALGIADQFIEHCSVPLSQFNSARVAVSMARSTPTVSTVAALIDLPEGVKTLPVHQMVLYHCLGETRDPIRAPTVMPTSCITVKHVDEGEDAKHSCVAVASPAVLGGSVDVQVGPVGLAAGFSTRYEAPHEFKEYKEATVTPELGRHATSFALAVREELRKRGYENIVPVHIDVVLDRQSSRAQQRAWETILNSDRDMCDPQPLFPKREAGDAKSVRIISPNKSGSRAAGACAAYALQAAFTDVFPSFIPGKTNEAVDEHVAQLFTSAPRGQCGDVEAMDGSHGPVTFTLVRMMLEIIAPECVPGYLECFDVKYKIDNRTITLGQALGSGSPVTTFHNTFTLLFAMYLASILSGDLHRTAFTRALYCSAASGDDSISMCTGEKLTAAFAALGLRYTPEEVVRGEPCTFLGRVYMPWDGSPINCCDLDRTFKKIHLSSDTGVPRSVAFANKIRGLAITDHSTPGIRFIVSAFKRIEPEAAAGLDVEGWRARNEKGRNVNNAHVAWMDDYATLLGYNFTALREHCAAATNLETLILFPVLKEFELKVAHHPQVVERENGEISVIDGKPKPIAADSRLPTALAKTVKEYARLMKEDSEASFGAYLGYARRVYVEKRRLPLQAEWAVFHSQRAPDK